MKRPPKRIVLLCALAGLSFGWAEKPVQFEDVTRRAGINWTHVAGETREKYLIETMGAAAAFLDYDRDGRLDIFLVNSGPHARSLHPEAPAPHALYRNQGRGLFRNVTESAGLVRRGYGNGIAVGDYDNDGWPDLYVTGFGRNTLFRNRGNGSFEDVTERAGVGLDGWSTSAAFFDSENDGDLDLFVCLYLDWDYARNVWCGERRKGYRSYCHPDYFEALPSRLFRNNGDGTFSDATRQAGVDARGKALGVVTGDIDGNGLADIYVANDATANHLFLNRGGGRFEEMALLAEVAYGAGAKPESGMGTDLGDVNGDGRLDLIVTNIDYQLNNLHINQGDGFFSDHTVVAGLAQDALLLSGFGVRLVDYDLDGDLDLVVLNGHPLDTIELYRNGVTWKELPLLFENRGNRFASVGSESGPVWRQPLAGRALATGDYDNDGDPDFLFANNRGPALLIQNRRDNANQWLGFEMEGVVSNRDAVGTVITLTTNRRRLVRHRQGGGSYQSAHDPRLVFGLGPDESVRSIEIRWPSGRLSKIPQLALNRYHRVTEPRSVEFAKPPTKGSETTRKPLEAWQPQVGNHINP